MNKLMWAAIPLTALMLTGCQIKIVDHTGTLESLLQNDSQLSESETDSGNHDNNDSQQNSGDSNSGSGSDSGADSSNNGESADIEEGSGSDSSTDSTVDGSTDPAHENAADVDSGSTNDSADDSGLNAPEWSVAAIYNENDLAYFQGNVYLAKWWTQGDQPDLYSGADDVWRLLGAGTIGDSKTQLDQDKSSGTIATTYRFYHPELTQSPYQLTLPQGSHHLDIFAQDEIAQLTAAFTNNPELLAIDVPTSGGLRVTTHGSGRASITLEGSAGKQTIGVRILDADGSVPGLPDYLALGSVSEDSVGDLSFWQDYSQPGKNKRMDMRYIYLNGGPYLGWSTWNGNINREGGRAISYIRESLKLGMVPAFIWYNIPDGGESYWTDKQHIQDAQYMKDYFLNLKLMLDIIQTEAPDEPVTLILEPDFIGYMAQNNENPRALQAYADAAYSSGVLQRGVDPEFSNTMRGLVESINYTIAKFAPNARFGWQMNLWASPQGGWVNSFPGTGLVHLVDDDWYGFNEGKARVYAEAEAITRYYIESGVLSYGAHFLSIDKYGLDAGFEGKNNDPASTMWFWNNDQWLAYLEFVRAMHNESGLPIVLWQLPVGHINGSQASNPYSSAGTFADFTNTTADYEDSASTFFFGDQFTEHNSSRWRHFTANHANDPGLVAGQGVIRWSSHWQQAAEAGVTLALFGPGVGMSTENVGAEISDDHYWITRSQQYLTNPQALYTKQIP